MIIRRKTPDILHAIVGTAGHVDHGKTSLVKLLTGCDTDRLPEEKARGMSIDLGFAPCTIEFPDGPSDPASAAIQKVVGIVDVPGHRDFIRNMVAGAASIDVLLLVIAADDGIMPQTDEHMTIVRLLRQPNVLVALTKVDRVSPERLEEARGEVAAFLARVGFADTPIIPVSNKTGEGIGDIRDTIARMAADAHRRRAGTGLPDSRAFRMSVERVFSVQGYGTVVTGIPVSGSVSVGEKVEMLPLQSGTPREFAVRTIQMYKHETDTARAQCCCAINLRELAADAVRRGMTIATPGLYRAATELLVSVENVSAEPLKRRFDARLHTGTAAVDASIKLLDRVELAPGPGGDGGVKSSAFAQVLLRERVVIATGDRFILRSLSPAATLGGGVVLSAEPQRVRHSAEVLPRLSAAFDAAQRGDLLAAACLAGPSALLAAPDVHRLSQSVDPAPLVAAALAQGWLVDLSTGQYLLRPRLPEIVGSLEKQLARYHREHPHDPGMSAAQLSEVLEIPPRAVETLLPLLTPPLAIRHGRLALASHKPLLSDRLLAQRERLLGALDAAGLAAPARGNLLKELRLAEAELKLLEKTLLAERAIVLLDGNLMLATHYSRARDALLTLFTLRPSIALADYRDALGASRKIALALLDAFDAEGITRRVGDTRVLAKPKTPAKVLT